MCAESKQEVSQLSQMKILMCVFYEPNNTEKPKDSLILLKRNGICHDGLISH